MSAPVCFVDTETSGLHSGRVPWDIAVIRRDPDGSEHIWEAFIEVDLSDAARGGLRIGRFYDRHPVGRWLSGQTREWPTPDDTGPLRPSPGQPECWYVTRQAAARHVARCTHGAHIVGAVPNFDTETLDPLLRGQGLISAHHYHLVDIENLTVGFLAGQGRPMPPPWSSDELTALLGLPPIPQEERHTALGDARWAMRVYDRVMSGVPL